MAKPSACVSLDSLVDLACRDGVDVRPTLARVLTDLYVQRPSHSGEEEIQYVELVLGLIDSVDAKTRAAIAAKLRQYPKAPPAVLHRLDSLAGAKPAEDENSADLRELFFSSAAEERRLILMNLDVVSDPTRRRPVPSEGELVRRLERAALRRNPSEFSRILARALNISQGLAERISFDSSGEPVIVVAKVLGMKTEVVQRILLLLNPAVGRSVMRIFELCQLYGELSSAAAEHMLTIWQAKPVRPRAEYETVYWDDEHRGARSSGTEITRAGVQQTAQAGRTKINER
jgi:uncharacterized protein (DUF2336 family)